MKTMYAAFENLFGGGKVYSPNSQPASSPVTITAFSQPNVLRKRMEEEKLSHGGTVRANLSPVRLDMDHGAAVLYFCPMRAMHVLNTITGGDGGSIPLEAKIEGLRIPVDSKSGFYELKNVEVTSNGAILVRATKDTAWELVERPAYQQDADGIGAL
jgi:hypothetical protein